MNLNVQIYEFASSAGAFEGYVYAREKVDVTVVQNWVANLHAAYLLIPEDVLVQIQPFIDQTLGRAFRSVAPLLGEKEKIAATLKSMIKGPIPESPDDFRKKKWFQE